MIICDLARIRYTVRYKDIEQEIGKAGMTDLSLCLPRFIGFVRIPSYGFPRSFTMISGIVEGDGYIMHFWDGF